MLEGLAVEDIDIFMDIWSTCSHLTNFKDNNNAHKVTSNSITTYKFLTPNTLVGI
jgi:hypothetical protein